jgi:hypothetical protein
MQNRADVLFNDATVLNCGARVGHPQGQNLLPRLQHLALIRFGEGTREIPTLEKREGRAPVKSKPAARLLYAALYGAK